jgi:predicted DNA-binding transcriptional regulator YafY
MRFTARQDRTRTLTDLCRAQDRRRPVTISYVKAGGEETVRTIEVHDIATTALGDLTVTAMDRASRELRTFRVDRIVAYSVHRGRYTLRPPHHLDAAPVVITSIAQLIAREVAREDPTYRHDVFAELAA